VSVPEEHFDVISSKEISLVNKSVVMALVWEAVLHHFQHICRKIKSHNTDFEIVYLFYISFSDIPRIVEATQMSYIFVAT
jgi:hypothetical protein